ITNGTSDLLAELRTPDGIWTRGKASLRATQEGSRRWDSLDAEDARVDGNHRRPRSDQTKSRGRPARGVAARKRPSVRPISPIGWSVMRGAAQQGVAADGASRRR